MLWCGDLVFAYNTQSSAKTLTSENITSGTSTTYQKSKRTKYSYLEDLGSTGDLDDDGPFSRTMHSANEDAPNPLQEAIVDGYVFELEQ